MLKAKRPSKTQKEKSIEEVKKIDKLEEKTQRFNVDIPASLHRRIKIQATTEGLKLNELAVKLFEDYLSKISKN
jgi:predicted HicB family RNase H-like nuclease